MADTVRKVFGVRLPVALVASVKGQAAVEGLTLEVWVERALRGALGERPSAVVPTAASETPAVGPVADDPHAELRRLMAAGKISRGMPTKERDPWDEDFDQRRDDED